jgi:hypothetical protein
LQASSVGRTWVGLSSPRNAGNQLLAALKGARYNQTGRSGLA